MIYFVTYDLVIILDGPLFHPDYSTSSQLHCHIKERRSSVMLEDTGDIIYNSSRDKTEI
jgi:hypothetical protein